MAIISGSLVKYSAVILVAFLAIVFFFDKALAVGLSALLFFVAATFLILIKIGLKDKKLYSLFLLALLIHLSVVLLIYYAGFRPVSGGADYELYDEVAREISSRARQGNFSLEGLFLGHGFALLMGILYTFTLPEMIIGQLFILWFLIFSLLFIYLIIIEIGGSPRSAFFVGLIAIFYPSYLYFGSLMLKDTIIIPLVLLGLLLAVKMAKNFSWQKFLLFFIILSALIQLRFYIGYSLLYGFLISWFLISNFKLKKRIIYGIAIIIILGFSPQISGEGYYGLKIFEEFLNPQKITFYREIVYSPVPETPIPETPVPETPVPEKPAPETPGGAGSSYTIETGLDKGPFAFFKNYFLSFIYAFLGPFPWQFRYQRQAAALAETIPWYLLLAVFISGFIKFIRKKSFSDVFSHYKFCIPLLLFSLIALGALSLFINNFGIVLRIRIPIVISLLCVGFLNLPLTKNSPFKIAFLTPVLKGAGAERNVVNLANRFDKTKYRVSVITGKTEGNFKDQLHKDVGLVSFNSAGILFLFLNLARYLGKENPDILVSALPHANIISMMAKIFSQAPSKVVLTEHTIFSLIPQTAQTFYKKIAAKFIMPHFMRLLYPMADSVVCVSKASAEDLFKIIGHSDKIKIIHNPVIDESIYSFSKEPLGGDSSLFGGNVPTIIAAGRLVKAKDYPNLLRALKIVLGKRPARLVVLGEGAEEKKLKNYASELKIFQYVHFLGFKPNPYKYMANSSLFVMSSIREGFGNAIVEAMALGLPVVSTDCGGPGDIIENGKSGILVPPANEKLLADAILNILNNPSLSEKLLSQGKIRAQDFTIEKSFQKYEKLFEEILNK